MSDQSLRIAIIGAFGHSLDVLTELERENCPARLVGWAPGYLGEDAENFLKHPLIQSIPRFEGYGELLQMNLDWVVVSTRLDRIASVAADCLRAGCHVIAEKPLALTHNDLQNLHQAWLESGCNLTAMFSMENLPAFRAARDAVKSGQIGRVLLAEARKSYKWGERPLWFGEKEKYGGTFPWIGIHALNIVQFVTGVRFLGGSSRHANLTHPMYPGCEDVCIGSLTTDSGALINISVDLARPACAATHGDDWCRIVGTEGLIEANASKGWCNLISGSESTLPLQPIGAKFAKTMALVMAGNPCADDTLRAFHLTDTSLLLRDFAASGGAFYTAELYR